MMKTERHILIVEDNRDMAEALSRALGCAGYSSRVAQNGALALDAVAACAPALVLLDILMPVMDGWQCARELRARYGNTIPIIVITAAEDAHARGAAIGAEAVLGKPFELDELLQLVKRYAGDAPANA
jgi:DNA-binding response OmpR family regulator